MSVPPTTERHTSPYRWVVLACGTLAFSTSYLVRSSHAGIGKSLQSDLHLNKETFGHLASAFFYAYALAQIPWGTLTDRLGGRVVVAGGTLLTGAAMASFALVTDLNTAMLSRAAIGLLSASVFVPMAAVCACWFASRERGAANSLYHGVGGGLGQLIALWLMPLLASHTGESLLGVSGWRRSILLAAILIVAAGTVAALFMRARPPAPVVVTEAFPETQEVQKARADYGVAVRAALQDVRLWLLVGVFLSFTMTIRLVQNWVQIYTADLLMAHRGLPVLQAQVRAGIVGLGLVIGTTFGEPMYGRLSDAALRRGVARGWLMAASLASKLIAFFLLMIQLPHPAFYAAIALVIGAVGNSAPIVSAAASEIFGEQVAGFAMGVVNTVGQLAGAFVLTVSGWIGMTLASEPGNAVSEYMPIWWLGIGCSLIGIASGIILALKHPASVREATALA